MRSDLLILFTNQLLCGIYDEPSVFRYKLYTAHYRLQAEYESRFTGLMQYIRALHLTTIQLMNPETKPFPQVPYKEPGSM